jgi:hypothetical protein
MELYLHLFIYFHVVVEYNGYFFCIEKNIYAGLSACLCSLQLSFLIYSASSLLLPFQQLNKCQYL